jgi:hypothetical protein
MLLGAFKSLVAVLSLVPFGASSPIDNEKRVSGYENSAYYVNW